MRRPLRGIIVAIGVVFGLLLVVALYLIVSFDPNRYRTDITGQVQAQTGRILTIQGDIELQLFPWVGLRLGETLLSGPEGFGDQPFVRLGSVSIKARLLPLLRQRLEVDTIVLKGLAVNLLTDVEGNNNWDFSGPAVDADKGADTEESITPPVASGATDMGAGLASLHINGLDIRDARLSWFDASNQARITLDQLTLTTGAIELGRPAGAVDIALSFNLSGDPLPEQVVAVGLATRVQFEEDGAYIGVTSLKLHVDGSTLDGEARLALISGLPSSFALSIDSLDIDHYLPPDVVAQPLASGASPLNASVDSLDLPLELLRGMNLQGQIRMASVKVAGLRASNIDLMLSANAGLIRLQPFQAELYQGQVKGELGLDVRPARPRFSLQADLDGFQVEPFMRDLLDSDLIAGKGAMTVAIESQGDSVGELTRRLQGKANFNLSDGAIKGFNIAAMIRRAEAKMKSRPAADAEVKQTDFTAMTASISIKNGIVTNRDLSAQAPFLRISGDGTVNLVNETIDYHLRAKVVAADQGQDGADLAALRGTTFPIRVRGPLADPQIKLDSAVIKDQLRQKAKQKITEELQQQQDELKARLKEQARDKLKQRLKSLF